MNVSRRVYHHVFYIVTLLCLFATVLFALPHAAHAQEEAHWWPHPIWGSDDQAGASNWITPEKVMESLSVVQTGKVYELGFTYHRDMPLIGSRTYRLNIPSTAGPFGESGMMAHFEKLTADIGQIGTQFDGLGHIGKRITDRSGEEQDVFYNGFAAEDVYAPNGLKRLGIEHVKPIITRGFLIDVAGYKATPTLPDGYVVTMDDVRKALGQQNIDETNIRPGDALLFNFGWWRIADEHERYTSFNWPGIDHEVAKWIIEKEASMIGSDTSGDPPGRYSVHFELLMKNGIYNLEFMTFESLLADEIHEFLFIFTPVRFKGATGSPGRPIAIR